MIENRWTENRRHASLWHGPKCMCQSEVSVSRTVLVPKHQWYDSWKIPGRCRKNYFSPRSSVDLNGPSWSYKVCIPTGMAERIAEKRLIGGLSKWVTEQEDTRKPRLTPRHKRLRLSFVRAHRNLTVNHWRNVLFGDETIAKMTEWKWGGFKERPFTKIVYSIP